jgi:hypothetical protein
MARISGTLGTWIVCLCCLLIVASSCSKPFTLKAIDAGSVPERIRERAFPPEWKDIVWRACFMAGEMQVTVMTYVNSSRERSYWVSLHSHDGGSGAIGPLDRAFGAYLSERVTSRDGGITSVRRMIAYGNAFDVKAAKVIGTTTTGQQVESPVVNGFWCLQVASPPPSEWESIVVIGLDGKIYYRYPIPRRS